MYLKRKIIIKRLCKEVFAYISNFSNLFEWDDNVIEGHRCDLGDIREGSQFLIHYSLLGKKQVLTYRLMKMVELQYLYFFSENENFVSHDKIFFEAKDSKTILTYEASILLKSSFVESLLQVHMSRVADNMMHKLKLVLERPTNSLNVTKIKDESLKIYQIPFRFSSIGWKHAKKNFFATEDAPKNILITGVTSGIGLAATILFASKGCDLVLIARNSAKLQELNQTLIQRGYRGKVIQYICDMQNINQVRKTCRQILEDGHDLDAIVNNAGALFNTEKIIDEVEQSTVVNFISPCLLSTELAPLLAHRKGCLINVSSGGMYSVPLDIEKLIKSPSPYSGSRAYAFAKRAMLVFSHGLDQELKEKGVRVHCMHPGWVNTPGVLNALPGFHKITKNFLRTPFQGADTIVWLAMTNPKRGGQFWLDRKTWPFHILNSTQKISQSYKDLKLFLKQKI